MMETQEKLRQVTIKALKELIQANLDSYRNLVQGYGAARSPKLSALFRGIAEERKAATAKLGAFVLMNDHQFWASIAGNCHRGDSSVIVKETRRNEEALKKAYKTQLIATAGNAVSDILHEHYASIVKSCAQMDDVLQNQEFRRGGP